VSVGQKRRIAPPMTHAPAGPPGSGAVSYPNGGNARRVSCPGRPRAAADPRSWPETPAGQSPLVTAPGGAGHHRPGMPGCGQRGALNLMAFTLTPATIADSPAVSVIRLFNYPEHSSSECSSSRDPYNPPDRTDRAGITRGSAAIQHGVGKRRETTGINRAIRTPERVADLPAGRPVHTNHDPRSRRSAPKYAYFRSCRAITMRWIWFVPS
jgi:hypothetical protein